MFSKESTKEPEGESGIPPDTVSLHDFFLSTGLFPLESHLRRVVTGLRCASGIPCPYLGN